MAEKTAAEVDWETRNRRRLMRRGIPREVADAFYAFKAAQGCGCCAAPRETRNALEAVFIKAIAKAVKRG